MWNEIELLLNEDTGQLPVGLGQECGTALYQVDTLLQISSSEKVQPIKAVLLSLINLSFFLSNNYLGSFVMFLEYSCVKQPFPSQVSGNPQLHARSSRDGSVVVVDRSVALLDSTGLSLLMHIQFGESFPLEFHWLLKYLGLYRKA